MKKCFLVTSRTNIDKAILFHNIDRFYIGDSECEFNFHSILRDKKRLKSLLQSGKKLTLLTPHMSQISLLTFTNFLERNKQNLNSIDEIVINDFGVFSVIKEKLNNITIIYWNYLFDQQKDPLLKYEKRANKENLNIDYEMYTDFFEKENIKALEIYNPIHGFSIHNLNIKCHLYYPYVVQSVTRYCNRSLISDNINYSKIVDACSGCKWKENIKFQQKVKDTTLFSQWNKAFYWNFSYKYIDNSIDRIIYNYDLKD